MTDILQKITDLCSENGGHKVLYVTLYGSHLYGTAGPDSDKDYKFLFLPNKDFLLSGKRIKHITVSSGNDGGKNTENDVDIQGWSIQYFCELLAKGETNALDVLYSYTNPETIIYKNPAINELFKHHEKFYNLRKVKSFLGYANAQAKKYGIKGDRLKIFKDIMDDCNLQYYRYHDAEYTLGHFIQHISENYGDAHNCNIKFEERDDGKILTFLHINGSYHMSSIKLSEFMDRVEKEYGKYGKRAEQAMISDGEDYKALSHAYRCFIQYEQLMQYGYITFPIYKRLGVVKRIKNGDVNSESLHAAINNRLNIIEGMNTDNLENKYDKEFVEDFILSLYKYPKKLLI